MYIAFWFFWCCRFLLAQQVRITMGSKRVVTALVNIVTMLLISTGWSVVHAEVTQKKTDVTRILIQSPTQNVVYPKQQKQLIVQPQLQLPPDELDDLVNAMIEPPKVTQTTTYNSATVKLELSENYDLWLQGGFNRQQQVQKYQQYLQQRVGFVPPMQQLLKSARSWADCGFEPYEIPPEYLWENIIPTLFLFKKLKELHIVPPHVIIRSVYRNAALNDCAEGSPGSKHIINAAMDLWIEGQDDFAKQETERKFCNFWRDYGEQYQLGLGLYPTGSIHIDTQGWRKWGKSHGASSSPCE